MVGLIFFFSLLTDFQLFPLGGCSAPGRQCQRATPGQQRAPARSQGRHSPPGLSGLLLSPAPRGGLAARLIRGRRRRALPSRGEAAQALRGAAAAARASPRWGREGAQAGGIFNVVRPAHLSLRRGRRREPLLSSEQAAGRKTFSMRNEGRDPEPSCRQRCWGQLGSSQHLKPKQCLINKHCLFNLVRVLFKPVAVDWRGD